MAGVGDVAFSSGDVIRRLTDLERQLREMRGERRLEASSLGPGHVFTARDDAQDLRSVDTYGDLTIPGPRLPNVPITSSHRALLIFGALVSWADTGTDFGGCLSVEMTGANTYTPDDLLTARHIASYPTSGFYLDECSVGRVEPITWLNEGPTTFTLKYRAQVAGVNAGFSHRYLHVITL